MLIRRHGLFTRKKYFNYNDSTTKIEVFDENFNTTSHPLAEAFNRNKVEFRCMQEIVIHPTLPFALIIEQGKMPTEAQLAAAGALPDPADEIAWIRFMQKLTDLPSISSLD